MKKTLKIKADNDWRICAYSNVSDSEMQEISDHLKAMGASSDDKVKVFENLNHDNRGTTVSNAQKRCIMVLISHQTDRAEFINTLSHEVRHVVDLICTDLQTESPAYLTGEIMSNLVELE